MPALDLAGPAWLNAASTETDCTHSAAHPKLPCAQCHVHVAIQTKTTHTATATTNQAHTCEQYVNNVKPEETITDVVPKPRLGSENRHEADEKTEECGHEADEQAKCQRNHHSVQNLTVHTCAATKVRNAGGDCNKQLQTARSYCHPSLPGRSKQKL